MCISIIVTCLRYADSNGLMCNNFHKMKTSFCSREVFGETLIIQNTMPYDFVYILKIQFQVTCINLWLIFMKHEVSVLYLYSSMSCDSSIVFM